MVNDRTKAFLKIIFPVIFISYACCISFFFHTHIVNGVTIVHSHPFSTDDNGDTGHEHTGVQFELIQTLSVFFIAGLIAFSLFLKLITPVKCKIYYKPSAVFSSVSPEGISRLRPPPYL